MDYVVILLHFCALGSGVGFCGNPILVMRPETQFYPVSGKPQPPIDLDMQVRNLGKFPRGIRSDMESRRRLWMDVKDRKLLNDLSNPKRTIDR